MAQNTMKTSKEITIVRRMTHFMCAVAIVIMVINQQIA